MRGSLKFSKGQKRGSKPQTVFNGDVFTTKCGDCKVINYENSHEITVRFLNTAYETVTSASCLRLGKVKDPYFPNQDGGYRLKARIIRKQWNLKTANP